MYNIYSIMYEKYDWAEVDNNIGEEKKISSLKLDNLCDKTVERHFETKLKCDKNCISRGSNAIENI